LNARSDQGVLPIDWAANEEMRQAIRDEPRRRMDEAPGKRATDQDRHPDMPQDDVEVEELSNKKPRLEEGTEVAEEDEPSEPSDEEDDGN